MENYLFVALAFLFLTFIIAGFGGCAVPMPSVARLDSQSGVAYFTTKVPIDLARGTQSRAPQN